VLPQTRCVIMDNAIETTGLVKRYGARRALDGFTLSVPRFAVFGLVGPNGAGKTTWMMSVAGLTHLTGGSVNLLGSGAFDPQVHSGRLAILPQDSELPPESRPLELLTHFARIQGLKRQEAARSATHVLEAVHLGDRLHAPIRSLSHGMRKRVMIAQCFLGYPEVVLLDEPLSGLDPREVENMRGFFTRQRGRQTIVISSHNLHDIERLCTHVAFIDKGRAVRVATLDEVTGRAGKLIYRVTAMPTDRAALEAAVPDTTIAYDAERGEVVCHYNPTLLTAEAVNARLLPALLAQCGLLAVSRGDSLETEYLRSL